VAPFQRKLRADLRTLDVEAWKCGAGLERARARRRGVRAVEQTGKPRGAHRTERALDDPEQHLPGGSSWSLDIDAVLVDVGETLGGCHGDDRTGPQPAIRDNVGIGLIIFAAGDPDRVEAEAGDGGLTDGDVAAFECEGLEQSLSARWCIGIVLDATGISLTAGWEDAEKEWISPESVRAMAADLEAADLEKLGREWRADPRATDELLRWFRVCAARGLGVIAR
jgi:hypothetical protein